MWISILLAKFQDHLLHHNVFFEEFLDSKNILSTHQTKLTNHLPNFAKTDVAFVKSNERKI